jgi:uncharacterized protein (DUF934 family)
LRVVKDNKVIEDSWLHLVDITSVESLAEGDVILALAFWKDHQAELLGRSGQLGVCVGGDDDIDDIVEDLTDFSLIAIEFPTFRDGRGYSLARILRDHHNYQGDIRAIGDVLRDQLFFMQRCGFSSFQVREDRDMDVDLSGFSDFSITYQSAADGALPVYKIR